MHANAFSLNEQDMQDIAAYLASFKPATEPYPVRGDAAAGKAKSTTCAACHGPDGNGNIPLYPRLAGQHAQYTENQLRAFNKRERSNDNAVMHSIASKLSELELKSVAAYISGLE